MIENNMLNDRYWRSYESSANQRMSYYQDMQRQAEKKEQGCIKPVPRSEGSRFDVRG